MEFPEMLRISQRFEGPVVEDVPAEVRAQLQALDLGSRVKAGQSVAVGCSSRGLANHAAIVRSVVSYLRDVGLKPFLFPAMGSHGGATAEGQVRILSHYGISEEALGVPVHSSLEVVQIGETPDGVPVYLDKHASLADHVVLINRIKKHTEFENDAFESGLQKMLAIGIGKQVGASAYHDAMFTLGYARVISTVAHVALEKAHILCGVGIVENGNGQTARIGAASAEDLVATEAQLFALSKQLDAKLPVDEADVIVIDEMGKDISGTGFDTKVVGRIGLPLLSPEPEKPKIKRIVVCDLTEGSEGNAVGVGVADFVTRRLLDKIDFHDLNMNAVTGVTPEMARVPMTLDNDREAIATAIKCVGGVPAHRLKLVRIRNTSELGELEVSKALEPEIRRLPGVEVLDGPRPMGFDAHGNLSPLRQSPNVAKVVGS